MKGNNIIIAIAAGLALILAPYIGISVASQDYTPIYVSVAVFLLLSVAYHGLISFSVMMATLNSALILPVFGRPYWWEAAAMLGFSGVVMGVLFNTMAKDSFQNFLRYKLIFISMIAYGGLLFFLMREHGVGLNVLGSGRRGGAPTSSR